MTKNPIRVISTILRPPWVAARQLCTASEASEATENPSRAASRREERRLYRRLSCLGKRDADSVDKTLDAYVKEGKFPTNFQLFSCAKELRKYNRFLHALQIIEWMERRKMILGYQEHTIRIDLISKIRGVTAAEQYFEGLSTEAKDEYTYGSLLSCYCQRLMTEKSLVLFKKMDDMGFVNTSLPFNNLMTLHLRLGRPKKVIELVEEMKSREVPLNDYTYNVWMQSCGNLSDIDGAERVLKEMEKGGKVNWTIYSTMANIYVKAGKYNKAEDALKMLEAAMKPPSREAYHFLITLYASISNLSQVQRVWNLLQSLFESTTNVSYLVLIPALSKLKDVEGIRKWFQEWESSCASYDVRVVHTTIRAYLEHGMYEDAVSVLEGALERGKGNLSKAREMLMVFSLKSHQLDPALEHLNAAVREGKAAGMKWRIRGEILHAFFSYFEEAKDIEGAEKFCKVLKHIKCLDYNAYHLLLKVYAAAEKEDLGMRERLENDNIEMRPELESLLRKICPE